MSIYDKSSLVLIPSGTKAGKVYSQKPVSGDGDFTFTRSSAATRVNASGNIEKETSNLLLQSNTFDTTWTQSNNPIITSGQSGYDGTSDAWKIELTAAYGQILQSISISGLNCTSVYAKAGTIDFIRFRIDGSPNSIVDFNLTDGSTAYTLGNIYATSTSVGGGWYRLSMVSNISSSTLRIYPLVAANDLSGTSGYIYIQDAQIEQGLVARDYIETTTSAVYGGITDNVPRLDYTDSSCPALLLEPQRTNLVTQSEYLGSYTPTLAAISDNVATSPEGVANAGSFIENTSSGRHRTQTNSFAVSSGSTYTLSMFVKNKSGSRLLCINADYLFNARSYFDIVEGSVEGTDSGSASIEDYGNGWYRCSVTGTSSITGSSIVYIGLEDNAVDNGYLGDGTSGHYWYGIQAEAGSYATSYIPTYGSSVTRVSETCDSAGNASTFNSTEGVLYAEISALEDLGTARRYISLSDGSSNNDVRLYYNNTIGEIVALSKVGGVTQFVMSDSGYDLTETHKIAVKYKVNDFALWIDGVEVDTDSSGSVNAANTFDELAFNGNNLPFFGRAKQVLTFNTALSNEELADLTTL
jgi:hypothetical protein